MQQPFDVIQDGSCDRHGLVRSVLINTPLVVASAVATLWLLLLLLGGDVGALIGLTLMGLVLFSTLFQSVTALRDLRAESVTTTGTVLRKRRPGIIFMLGRTHYLRLAEGAFVVSVLAYHQVQEGDEVEINHWPNTRRVIRVRLLRQTAASDRSLDVGDTAAGGSEEQSGAERWRPPHLR